MDDDSRLIIRLLISSDDYLVAADSIHGILYSMKYNYSLSEISMKVSPSSSAVKYRKIIATFTATVL